MSKEVFTLRETAPLDDAAWGLRTRGIGAAPVRNQRGRLVGIVSKSDLGDASRRTEPFDANASATVSQVMTKQVICVLDEDPAMVAVHRMVHADVHHLLVLNDAHRLVGIVTSTDILKALDRGERLGDAIEHWTPTHPEWDFVETPIHARGGTNAKTPH